MPRPISKLSFRLLGRVALPVLVAACAAPALAQTVEGTGSNKVMMFDRPPTVDELRETLKPAAPVDGQEQPKIRTRSIEIVGSGINGAQRPRQTESAAYGSPAMQQAPVQQAPMQQQMQQAPMQQPQMQQPAMAQPEPAPQPQAQPKPKRPAVQEAAAPPMAPAPSPRPSHRQQAAVQPATLSTQEEATAKEEQPTNGFGFRINFAFNSADVPKEFYSYVDAVGGLMNQDPSLRLVIEGHTDSVGGDQYNLGLSERRAVSVGEYLVRVHHVEPQRLAIAGMGKTQPLTPDPTDSRNRRVEFRPVQ